MEVVWSDLAFESLYDIVEYIQASFSRQVADDATQKIVSFVEMLADSPQMGKRVTYFAQHGEIRCAFLKRNHIYYQLREDKVEIILVWDGRQDKVRLRSILEKFLSKRN